MFKALHDIAELSNESSEICESQPQDSVQVTVRRPLEELKSTYEEFCMAQDSLKRSNSGENEQASDSTCKMCFESFLSGMLYQEEKS